MSFKSELEDIRDKIIKENNDRFQEEIKSIIVETMANIDYDVIAEKFRKVVKENPINNSFKHIIDINLDKLITKCYSLDENNRPIENTKQPLKIYYSYKGLNYYFICNGSSREVYLNSLNFDTYAKMFVKYLEEVNPEIQSMLVLIKNAFDDASISCKAYISPNCDKCDLRITIQYDLKKVTL